MTASHRSTDDMLAHSQRLREELMTAVTKLDSYIELLRQDLNDTRDVVVMGDESTS